MDAQTIDLLTSIGMFILIGVVGFLALYLAFLPTIIACRKRHRHATIIFILNVFLGYTGIAWLIALIWACRGETE